jgi:dimethylargininase
MNFEYEYALVMSDIPQTLDSGLSLEQHDSVNLSLAREQHQNYLKTLEQCGVKLIKLEPDDSFPDCVFVEDVAIALKNRIFITNPGAESRRREVDAFRNKLNFLKAEINLELGEIENKDEAFLDGGDVMFTGREFIIGLSNRTNQKGFNFKRFLSLSNF